MNINKYQKIAKQLKGVILALFLLAFLLFIGVLPLVGKQLTHTHVEYENFQNITLLWNLLASLPIFYSIILLYLVVNSLMEGKIFTHANFRRLTRVSKLIKIDIILSALFYIGLLFFMPHSFILTFITSGIAIIGYLSAKFFDFLSFLVSEGITYYEDTKLTI